MVSVERTGLAEVSYEVLTELPQLSALSGEWNSLLGRSACNRAFSSAQWFISVCKLRLSELTPYVVVARRDGVLAGLLPLVLIDEGKTATFPDVENDYNDMVVASGDTPAMKGLLEHALSAAGGCQRFILSRVRDDSCCLRAAQAMEPDGWAKMSYHKGASCPYINLPPSYSEFLNKKSRSFRAGLRQAQRKAAQHGVFVSELDAGTLAPGRLPETFLSLHLSRFAEYSPLASPIAQAFVREVFPSLFIERRLRAFALFEAEKIIAIHLCMVGANSLCLWNGGFGAAAARWSPGRLLINAGIERAYALQLEEYDFLRGDESYKSRWASGERSTGRLEFIIGN
jgi:CelD/BcsL family acetyltransferase involved in cellulose biosynthesis